MLKESGFPEHAGHSEKHSTYLLKLANLHLDRMLQQDSVLDETIVFLQEWLLNHILQEDMRYKPYLAQLNA